MHTLLLRLTGPMQSWGTQSRFTMRDTITEPTKSGVIGLLCAALGWDRDHDLLQFNTPFLTIGVRVDRPGRMMMDYQTAQEIITADLTKTKTGVSRRYYLSDACFLVGLQCGDLDWLHKLHDSLREPVWPLFLGRKSFVPSLPVWLRDGLRVDETLRQALQTFPWLDRVTPFNESRHSLKLRHVIESDGGFVEIQDAPQTFNSRDRWYLPRRMEVAFLPIPSTRYKDAS